MFRDYEVGFRIGKLSLVILERFKATKLTAKVYTLVYGFLSVWKEPIQATVEGLQSGINTGFIEGDTSNANGARIIKYRQMLIAGFNLATVRDGLLRLCQDLVDDKARKVFFVGFHPALGDLYCTSFLIGDSEHEVSSIFGISQEENERVLLQKFSITGNTSFPSLIYYHRFIKAFYFRDYETAMQCFEKYDECTQASDLLRITDILTEFFSGLASFILSRRRKQKALMAKGEDSLMKMQAYADYGSKWNGENKALLLQAELHFCNGDSAKAEVAYTKSVQSAREHKFVHEEALAAELYGIFCVEEGNMSKGNELLEMARGLYAQWGAKKKADLIFPL